MAIALRSNQILQIQSFWNLIQTSDEDVQHELYRLLHVKYAKAVSPHRSGSSFFTLKGALKSKGSAETDRQYLNEYLEDKYNV